MKTKLVFLSLVFSLNIFSQSFIKKVENKPSLDELDYASFKASAAPFERAAIQVQLAEKSVSVVQAPSDILLDGKWQLLQANDYETVIRGDWSNAISAEVPGSVHTALVKAGRIPDPFFARNDSIAERHSYMTWWYKKEFTADVKKLNMPILDFGGVAVKCDVWLNGTHLGQHDGMFGGPTFDVSKIVKEKNTLLVKIHPAPRVFEKADGFFNGMNVGWRTTVVFNCVYGWHYSKIPSIGIWQSVKIKNNAGVEIINPFIATKNIDGTMDLQVSLKSVSAKIKGKLAVSVVPDNFQGAEQSFEYKIKSEKNNDTINFTFKINNAQLWWPNDMGKQNLYKLKILFTPDDKKSPADYTESVFGIRTVEMGSLPGGPYKEKFNWIFIINGKPRFVKGTGWCTMDPLMDFSRERYDRFLSLAKMQHIQMMRAWGCGMPETDDFYDLCDRYGIMIMQEWQTAWNSHEEQPYDILMETTVLNTLRIRNHPSLVMYGGGNESNKPFGKAIDMMGRLSIELDGTRPFHRGEPFGGSDHNYGCWWGKKHLDNNLQMTADFWGEYGIACMPVYESVMRYLPETEKTQWPASPQSSLVHHTPIFGTADDMARLEQYSGYIMPQDNLEHFITGGQLAQVVAVRHTLERSRTRWPNCAGALYYKMNDNYPAASWSCVDWYGAIKPMHYFAKNAFSPVASVILFEHTDMYGQNVTLPVYLLDENLELEKTNKKVLVRVFDRHLKQVAVQKFLPSGKYIENNHLGEITLTAEQTETSPLLFVTEVFSNDKQVYRTFYYMNFEERKGSLFNLPRTTLQLSVNGAKATIKNVGKYPAVGVTVECPGKAHEFTASDNFLWLDAGEEAVIDVNLTQGLKAMAWNLEGNEYVNVPEFVMPMKRFVDSVKVDFAKTADFDIRYTTDGSMPTLNSKLFILPFYVKQTGVITASAFDKNGKMIRSSSVNVEKIPALKTKLKKDQSYKNGIKRIEYKGEFVSLKDFDKAQKINTTVVADLKIDEDSKNDNFGYYYEGYINVEETGTYEFYLTSDDGSKIVISDYQVVINDGCHGAQTEYGLIGLQKGLHPIKIWYFDNKLGQTLKIEWRGAGFLRKQLDEGNSIFYK